MTDLSREAVERLATEFHDCDELPATLRALRDRLDRAEAEVAEAYEDAAKIVERQGHSLCVEIRSRTPDNARATLERIVAEAVKAERESVLGWLIHNLPDGHAIAAAIREGRDNG